MVFQEIPVFIYGAAGHCTDCSRVTEPGMAKAPVDMPAPTFDVSVSLDGAVLVTDTFREVCDEADGVVFAPLEGAPGVSLLVADRIVRVEPFDSHIRTGPACATCGEPRYVIRVGPLHLQPEDRLQPGFSRTDIGFGDTGDFGSTQPVFLRPHVLVDRDTGRLLKSAGLLGVHLIAQPDHEV